MPNGTRKEAYIDEAEYAVMCYLRLHPDVCKSYGIKEHKGLNMSIGAMLLQTLNAQGMRVDWYDQEQTQPAKATPNEKWANSWIKSVTRRPGAWLAPLEDRPEVAPPPKAAIIREGRSRGKLPKSAFPAMPKGATPRPRHQTSSCGNRIAPAAGTALVERAVAVSWIERRCLCASCGKHLRFCKTASRQVAACAEWAFVCEKGCPLPPLATSTKLGDDYELNSRLNTAIVTCAISFERMTGLLHELDTGVLSTTDHYATKSELEPILADAAERSMADAFERNMTNEPASTHFKVDAGFTAPRNAKGCTMPAHAADGAIIAVAHKRLTDEGAKSSKGLETLCYLELLNHPRVVTFLTAVMDGCRDLVAPTLAASMRAQGDGWHVGKNHSKWFVLAAKLLCRKAPAPAEPDNPVVPPVVVAAERREKFGRAPAGIDAIEFARERVRALGGEPPADADVADLKKLFNALARARAMTPAEHAQEARRTHYLKEVERRKGAAKGREELRASRSAALKEVLAWTRDIRSLLRYVSEYTATIVDKSDEERGDEFKRVFRKAGVALILGRTDDATLKLIKHPATDVGPDTLRKKPWVPPGKGYVAPTSFTFTVLDSLICDPTWDDKFPALIDGLSTSCCESFFHTLRKWGTKQSHFSRYYTVAIWCALLSWNENITRPILEHEWQRRKSGQLASSAGRCYKVPIRTPRTEAWRAQIWREYRAKLHAARPAPAPERSYFLGWYGVDPPERVRVAAAARAAAAPAPTKAVESLTVTELKTELAKAGLPTTGKKLELMERARNGRADLATACLAFAPKLARRLLVQPAQPERTSPRRGRRTATDERPVQPSHGLPSPYRLPASQRVKRRPPPKGQPKWTSGRVASAVGLIAEGKVPEPIKRRRTEADAEAHDPVPDAGGQADGDEADPYDFDMESLGSGEMDDEDT